MPNGESIAVQIHLGIDLDLGAVYRAGVNGAGPPRGVGTVHKFSNFGVRDGRDFQKASHTTMSCHNCARKTLSLFVRSIAGIEPIFAPSTRTPHGARLASTAARQAYRTDGSSPSLRRTESKNATREDGRSEARERLPWQIQKAAMKEKLGGEAWNPRKKLSPDTMEGIRHLHSTQPDKFTTPILAAHFKVSGEAIRRILKSKWRPSDAEYEDRMERWNKRGERIWTNLVEMGVKPPKKWREMGVGRATGGQKPKWKSERRNMVHVRDSASSSFIVDDGDIIPIVDGSGRSREPENIPLEQRL